VLAGDTASVPPGACAPVQPPDAEQAVALALDHLSVALPPAAIVAGVAVSVTVGIPDGCTVSTADDAADPPAPVQVRV
jgi:hypothetical protein